MRRARANAPGEGLGPAGEMRRSTPGPCALDRLLMLRKTIGPGGKVESGMTVGFRLGASVFNAVRRRDASRMVNAVVALALDSAR